MHRIEQIANIINLKAKDYKIGNLQKVRKDIKGLSRLSSRYIFDTRTTFEEWAWHYGGRRELQFNIGIEGRFLRYGVAFSLELSQTLPSIDILVPKITLFNEYVAENIDSFSDLRMWHYDNNGRSSNYTISPIPTELVQEGVFIFLGGKQQLDNINYSVILETFDRLLPLYLITESSNPEESLKKNYKSFEFKSGCSIKPSSATGNLPEKKLNIRLLHNDYQEQLYRNLVNIYGIDNVGAEISVNGTSIDLVVKNEESYYFYEIKTASTAKACIRQALGQILEYSYWPGNQKAEKLVIVGTPKCDENTDKYIKYLQNNFSIPIEYLSIND